jgi:hypothetical protein
VKGVKSELEAEGPGAATANRPIELGRLELLDLASIILYVVIIFDMVVKPFS